MFGKKQVAVLAAEFIGSGVLTLAIIGVQHSTIGVPYFVGLAAALAAAMLVLVFSAASGAVINPAITIALWSVRRLKTTAAVGYLAAQLLGAWAAYYVFTYHINTTLSATGGDFSTRVMVAEAVGAAILAFGWAAAIYGKFTPGVKAATVGLGYALGIVVASSASIGLINPGVALADRAWTIWGSMGWGTYVLGPVLGALIGFNLFAWLFTNEMSLKTLRASVGGSKPAANKAIAKKKPAAKKRK